MTTALDIRDYLWSHSPWLDPKTTVDTVKIGDPARPVKKAGVCWYPSIETIRAAHDAGCGMLVCHEPLFWEHTDPLPGLRYTPPGDAKRALLEATGMTVLRAHDSWDQWPDIGIRDAWARFLGFEKRIYASAEHNCHAVYEVAPRTLRELGQHIADRVRSLGEDSVQVIGDPDRVVSKPAVGVGCIVPDREAVEAGADTVIVCYDGASYWSTRERLHALGAAVITVEHGTSEMPGLQRLCEHLADTFPDVAFEYFAEHARTWTVRGRTGAWCDSE